MSKVLVGCLIHGQSDYGQVERLKYVIFVMISQLFYFVGSR